MSMHQVKKSKLVIHRNEKVKDNNYPSGNIYGKGHFYFLLRRRAHDECGIDFKTDL